MNFVRGYKSSEKEEVCTTRTRTTRNLLNPLSHFLTQRVSGNYILSLESQLALVKRRKTRGNRSVLNSLLKKRIPPFLFAFNFCCSIDAKQISSGWLAGLSNAAAAALFDPFLLSSFIPLHGRETMGFLLADKEAAAILTDQTHGRRRRLRKPN